MNKYIIFIPLQIRNRSYTIFYKFYRLFALASAFHIHFHEINFVLILLPLPWNKLLFVFFFEFVTLFCCIECFFFPSLCCISFFCQRLHKNFRFQIKIVDTICSLMLFFMLQALTLVNVNLHEIGAFFLIFFWSEWQWKDPNIFRISLYKRF